MMDLPESGRCRHHDCPQRRIRSGLCLDHLRALMGDGPLPWPDDLEPTSWRQRRHARGLAPAP